jgi:hypothetical protein
VLSGYVEHSGHFAQNRLSVVTLFVTLHHHNPVGLVDRKINPGELF